MDMEHVTKVIETGAKLKKIMKAKGIKRVKAKCPFCEVGFLHAVLAGRKEHLHMKCDGCDVVMME